MLIIFSFLVSIGLLVSIHEFGHFYVARFFGVRVKKFAIGFGRVLFSVYDKKNTEYSIRLIPLGGFVSMVSKNDEEYIKAPDGSAIEEQKMLVRMAIVAAGPLINLLLAFILIWGLTLRGGTETDPIITSVLEGSPAFEAQLSPGLAVVSVDDIKTRSVAKVLFALTKRDGESGVVKIGLVDRSNGQEFSQEIPVKNFMEGDTPGWKSLGLTLGVPVPAVIGSIEQNSFSEKAGLKTGDIIYSINGKSVEFWQEVQNLIQSSKGSEISINILRDGTPTEFVVSVGESSDRKIGITSADFKESNNFVHKIEYGFLESIQVALEKTVSTTEYIFNCFVKLMTGGISSDSVGGVISIAKSSGNAANNGIMYFIGFIAIMSINLAVFNLLPIPILDGGALVILCIEAAIGRPLSERVLRGMLMVGLAFFGGLVSLGLFNDLAAL